VEISTTLSTDLKNLLLVLNMPELELERSLGSLQRDVQQAVSSFVGLSISVVVSGQLVTLTSVDERLFERARAVCEQPGGLCRHGR
jgi:hypothetical protein